MSDDSMKFRPRLCHLKKWSNFQGYGFNLHAEKSRNGQYIGKVDANSPAESAGLKERDRIIEVNLVNISNENHQQVVRRIRNGLELNGQLNEEEVMLLVVDQEADDYFKALGQIVRNDMECVLRLETKPEVTNGHTTDDNNNHNQQKQQQQQQQQYKDNDDEYNDRKSLKSEKSESRSTSEQRVISTSSIVNNNNNTYNEHQTSSQPHTPQSIRSDRVLEQATTSHTTSATSLASQNEQSQQQQQQTSNSNNDIFRDDLSSQRSSKIDEIRSVVDKKSSENSVKKFPYSNRFHEENYRDDDKNNGEDDDYDDDSISNNISSKFIKEKAFVTTRQMLETNLELSTPEKRLNNINTSTLVPSTTAINTKSEYERFMGLDDRVSSVPSRQSAKEDMLNNFFKMSAKEFQQHLKQKTKADPRVQQVDMKQKHQIFQNM